MARVHDHSRERPADPAPASGLHSARTRRPTVLVGDQAVSQPRVRVDDREPQRRSGRGRLGALLASPGAKTPDAMGVVVQRDVAIELMRRAITVAENQWPE